MIADPDEPGYRYPQPGERLWHRPWQSWVVIEDTSGASEVLAEVPARRESDGQRVVVKLRSLEEPQAPMPPQQFVGGPLNNYRTPSDALTVEVAGHPTGLYVREAATNAYRWTPAIPDPDEPRRPPAESFRLICSICPWIGDEGRPPTPAVTIINGHAVCWEHHRAAHLARDHRHAVVLGGGTL